MTTTRPSRSLTIALAAMLSALAATIAFAIPPEPEPPILTRHKFNNRDWTLITEVRLYGFKSPIYFDPVNVVPLQETAPIVLESAQAVFPIIPSSSMHVTHPGGIVSRFDINNRTVDDTPSIVGGYQGPTSFLTWEAKDINTRLMTLHVEVPMTSYETRIDEKRAFDIPWPADDYEWDPQLAANLGAQLFIEPDHPSIKRLLNEWTNGKPRRAKPYYLAKYLAGKVVEHYMPEGRIVEATGRGATAVDVSAILVSGFRVDGSVHAAEVGKGSPLDAANLLTALYRAAGIPARLVVAYDVTGSMSGPGVVVRAWTEFYLYDPRNDTGQWIPVDIQNQRQFSSRMPPLKQRWQFFGHNEDFDFTAPIAHHWHPPTTVTNAGPPAIWGWRPVPANPVADQQIRFYVIETIKRGKAK